MGLPSHNVHLAKQNSAGVYVRHRPETSLLYQMMAIPSSIADADLIGID
jgi:hypothetical protein